MLKKSTMFTITQIQQAHSRVKSCADFPAYIQDLIALGVLKYETFVADGHTIYWGKEAFFVESPAKYDTLSIADTSDAAAFQNHLRHHQQGQSDYPTFCSQSAQSGVEKWTVDTQKMSCTYCDKKGNEMLVETIPQAK